MGEQPKHCEHECCPVEWRRAGKGDDGVIRCYPREKCLHDTRSRPAPALESLQIIPNGEAYSLSQIVEINENIRKQRREEREQVLDELYAWLSEKVEPHEAAMRVLTIGEKIKSLREGAK